MKTTFPELSGPTDNALFNLFIFGWRKLKWVLWERRRKKTQVDSGKIAAILGAGVMGALVYYAYNRFLQQTEAKNNQVAPPLSRPSKPQTETWQPKPAPQIPVPVPPKQTGREYPFEVVGTWRGETGELRKGAVYRFRILNRRWAETVRNGNTITVKKKHIKTERYL